MIDTTGWVAPPWHNWFVLRERLREMGLAKPLREQFREWGPDPACVRAMLQVVEGGAEAVQRLNEAQRLYATTSSSS